MTNQPVALVRPLASYPLPWTTLRAEDRGLFLDTTNMDVNRADKRNRFALKASSYTYPRLTSNFFSHWSLICCSMFQV